MPFNSHNSKKLKNINIYLKQMKVTLQLLQLWQAVKANPKMKYIPLSLYFATAEWSKLRHGITLNTQSDWMYLNTCKWMNLV